MTMERPQLEEFRQQCAEVPLEKQCWYVPSLVETVDYALSLEQKLERIEASVESFFADETDMATVIRDIRAELRESR